jgi:hypothetical protein
MLEFLSILFFILLCLSIYINIRQMLKHEKLEEIVLNKQNFIDKFSDIVKVNSERLNEIDSKGSFATDDEIGFFFNDLKKINDEIVEFINEQV